MEPMGYNRHKQHEKTNLAFSNSPRGTCGL